MMEAQAGEAGQRGELGGPYLIFQRVQGCQLGHKGGDTGQLPARLRGHIPDGLPHVFPRVG